MQYSDNLNLPLLEGTDTLGDLRSQGNGIVNGLEAVLGGLLDDIEQIPSIITEQGEQSADIEALAGRVTVLEEYKTKETVSINGTDTVVTKHIAKIEATMGGSSSDIAFKGVDDDATHRHVLKTISGIVNINLTEAFGVVDSDDIILKDVTTYQNGYQYLSTRNALPTVPVMVGKLPNQNDITLQLHGEAVGLYSQELTEQGGVETWTPSYPYPYSNNQTVIIVLEFYTM